MTRASILDSQSSKKNTNQTPLLMGILNITPDSFHDGGDYNTIDQALERAQSMVQAGADVLDVGGESTRPGAESVSPSEEKSRVIPVIKTLNDELNATISVDTSKSSVARDALKAGADWINDIYALRNDDQMVHVLADHDAPVVLMHMQGTPQTMQDNPKYNDVLEDIIDFLKERAEFAINNGIDQENIIVDPGIGFGKTLEHNRRIIRDIDRFLELGFPLLVGHSRKSFLGDVLDKTSRDRLIGTISVSSYLLNKGVNVLRVHDVEPHSDCKKIMSWLSQQQEIKD